MMKLFDGHGRSASYLRLSITDRCNLSCIYCRGENPQYINHQDIMRYEELLRIAKITTRQGIGKIRVTGGEPFARKGCMDFLISLRNELPDTRLCITTNGTLIKPYIDEIANIKPESVNISLDALDPEIFALISKKSLYAIVMDNIEKLLSLNVRLKLNAVILGKYTPSQLDKFIALAMDNPVDIRFIEFMPMGQNTIWNKDNYLSASHLLKILSERVDLTPVNENIEKQLYAGPAQMYALNKGKGRFGFITPISSHFCKTCNRIRVTSNGKLRVCLFDDREFDLRPLLRDSKSSDENIASFIKECLKNKPVGAEMLAARKTNAIAKKNMDGIGG